MKLAQISPLASLIVSVFMIGLLVGCQDDEKKTEDKKGAILAKNYCSGCHLFPDPKLLDKRTWREGVLPAMAAQFGIEVLQGNLYMHHKDSKLSSSEWQSILKYYESLAPESLKPALPVNKIYDKDWGVFELKKPEPDTSLVAATLMTAINPVDKMVYTSTLNNPGLYQWNHNFHSKLLIPLATPAIDIIFSGSVSNTESIVTCMGGMRALDGTKGDVFSLMHDRKNVYSKTRIGGEFIRPIQTRPIDFNRDGLIDYIVCGFGHNTGGLYILKQLPDKSFQKIPVREVPGATQAITGDFNKDGWLDIMALFAHADEGIWLFLSDKKGGFESRNILRFPSVYGSSSFQLVDVNKDDKPDIVYTAGDNSDYSRILKPYHGLYIYLNTGDLDAPPLKFKQSYFYPINGCTKAMAADFDQDGDMDIATIAFFADFKYNPSEGFIYFENSSSVHNNKLNFKATTIPVYKNGRWISMDVNDYDGDGDEDIVLGNYSKGFLNNDNLQPNWDVYTPYVILENKSRK